MLKKYLIVPFFITLLSINAQAAGTDADSDAYIEPKVDKYSGDLMYIENRAAVTRAADQTEDIKVIIEI